MCMKSGVIYLRNKNLEYSLRNLLPDYKYNLKFCYALDDCFVNAISRNECDFIILSSEIINNQYSLLNNLVHSMNNTLFILITEFLDYSYLTNMLSEPNFLLLIEDKIESIDESILYALKMISKIGFLENKMKKVEKEFAGRELILKAKIKLIDEKGYTEATAHRFIIDFAMKNRISKERVAKLILEGVIA